MGAVCAVIGCEKEGKPHVCPHDGRFHGHGCVHYNCGCPVHSLTFRTDGWYWLCDEHYEIVKREREEWFNARRDRNNNGR